MFSLLSVLVLLWLFKLANGHPIKIRRMNQYASEPLHSPWKCRACIIVYIWCHRSPPFYRTYALNINCSQYAIIQLSCLPKYVKRYFCSLQYKHFSFCSNMYECCHPFMFKTCFIIQAFPSHNHNILCQHLFVRCVSLYCNVLMDMQTWSVLHFYISYNSNVGFSFAVIQQFVRSSKCRSCILYH